MPANNQLKTVVTLASKFIEQKKGFWEHADWEDLLGQVAKAGITATDEVKINLGNMLESGKFFYGITAPGAPKAPKPRAGSKTK
jgi:hypothetical protein